MPRKVIASERSGAKNREAKIEGWVKERQTASIGRHMRTFARTKKKELITTYDDVDYLTFLQNIRGSDECAYFADACLLAYERGQRVGNMKDEVAAQKEALDLTCDYGLELLLDLSAQWPLANLMANHYKQDTISVAGVSITDYNEATMTAILQRMDKLELPVVLKRVLNDVNFIVKWTEPWQDVNNNDIPGSYVCIRTPYAASSTNEALVTNLWAEQGELKNHCKKFGIKLEKFSPDWLKPRIINRDHPDWLAFTQLTAVNLRNGADAADLTKLPAYHFAAANPEYKRWWFYNDPNESPINYLAPLFQPYDNPDNLYGGACVYPHVLSTADTFVSSFKFTDATAQPSDMPKLFERIDLAKEFLAIWENAGDLNFEITGTDITNTDIDLNSNAQISWFKSVDLDISYGTGIDLTAKDDTFISYLIELMF